MISCFQFCFNFALKSSLRPYISAAAAAAAPSDASVALGAGSGQREPPRLGGAGGGGGGGGRGGAEWPPVAGDLLSGFGAGAYTCSHFCST